MEESKTYDGFVEERKNIMADKADDCKCLKKCVSDCGFVNRNNSDDEDFDCDCSDSAFSDWGIESPIGENCKCTTTCIDCTKSIEMCVVQPSAFDKFSISLAKNKLLGNALWRQMKPPPSLSYIPPVVSARRTDVVRLQLQK